MRTEFSDAVPQRRGWTLDVFRERDSIQLLSQAVASAALRLIEEHKKSVVDRFYAQLGGNDKTAEFLTHEDVETRLKGSFESWLTYTFDRDRILADPNAFNEYQDNIGRIHSRIDIHLHLINYAKWC